MGQSYYREIWQFEVSKHYVSRHAMQVATGYTGDYVNATYADEAGMARTFERITSLPPEKSDNRARIERLRAFVQANHNPDRRVQLLDVGAGLGVFPYAVKQAGWECLALDPDPRAVHHLQQNVGVRAVCADFMMAAGLGRHDIVTFNKVLEHVEDPVAMLGRVHQFLKPHGLVYLELPDGEAASAEGFGREEFFIEHLHIFSFVSIAMLATRAGLTPVAVERLREPSSKFTLRAFCTPTKQ